MEDIASRTKGRDKELCGWEDHQNVIRGNNNGKGEGFHKQAKPDTGRNIEARMASQLAKLYRRSRWIIENFRDSM